VRIHVTLKGSLADRLPGGRGELDVAEGSTVEAVFEGLDVPGRQCVVVVNGAAVKADAVLRAGDRLQVFPPVAGG
jgi:sulfur carrier protein ThiS